MVPQGYGAGLRMWGNSVVPLGYHRDPFFRFIFRIYFLVGANISAQGRFSGKMAVARTLG